MARNSFNININLKGFPQAQRTIRKTKDGMDRMRISTSNLRRVVGALRNNLLLVSFAATIAAKTIGKFISAMSGFEDAKVRLQGLMGSVEGAERAFKKFNDVASTTPFELNDVVNAGVTLKAFGADAEDLIKTILDLAASMGMNAVDAANAFGRAYAGGAGAADIFREKGVLQIIKDFKGIEDITKLSLPQFRKAMIETFQDPAANIAGATDRMAGTFTGAFSNMSDSVIRLSAVIGDIFIVDIMDSMRGIGFLADSIRTLVERVREGHAEFGLIGDSVATFSDKIKDLTVEQLGERLKNVNKELEAMQKESKTVAGATVELADGERRYTHILDEKAKSVINSRDRLITLDEQYKSNTVGVGNLGVETEAVAIIIDKTTKTMQENTKTSIGLSDEISNLTMKQALLNAELKRKQGIDLDLQNIEGLFPDLYAKTAQAQMDNIQSTIDLIETYRDQLAVSWDVDAVLEMLKEKYDNLDPAVKAAADAQKELEREANKTARTILSAASAVKTLTGEFEDGKDAARAFLSVAGLLLSASNPALGAALQATAMFIGHTGGLIKNNGIQRFAQGGTVRGQDNVPIMAQAGEFIMRREAVRNIGVQNLAEMNRSGSSGGVTVNIQGNMVGNESFVRDTLIPEITRAQRMNLA